MRLGIICLRYRWLHAVPDPNSWHRYRHTSSSGKHNANVISGHQMECALLNTNFKSNCKIKVNILAEGNSCNRPRFCLFTWMFFFSPSLGRSLQTTKTKQQQQKTNENKQTNGYMQVRSRTGCMTMMMIMTTTVSWYYQHELFPTSMHCTASKQTFKR